MTTSIEVSEWERKKQAEIDRIKGRASRRLMCNSAWLDGCLGLMQRFAYAAAVGEQINRVAHASQFYDAAAITVTAQVNIKIQCDFDVDKLAEFLEEFNND